MSDDHPGHAASVIVPAHDEERSIGRLLRGLTTPVGERTLEIVVVPNGCTDATAERAAAVPGVQVVEIAEPSKHVAMRRGSAHATVFPRVYVAADVEIGAESVLRLVDTLDEGTVHACGPRRQDALEGVTPLVRWYHDVWSELPQVRQGLFGRGVIALSEEGHRRFEQAPAAMADDLVISELFSPDERTVVGSADVVVRPARTVTDLVRRRVRVRTGNAQADDRRWRGPGSRTTPATLADIVRRRPDLTEGADLRRGGGGGLVAGPPGGAPRGLHHLAAGREQPPTSPTRRSRVAAATCRRTE